MQQRHQFLAIEFDMTGLNVESRVKIDLGFCEF